MSYYVNQTQSYNILLNKTIGLFVFYCRKQIKSNRMEFGMHYVTKVRAFYCWSSRNNPS